MPSPVAPSPSPRDVVITGIGVVSPIGIGRDAFWQSLREGQSGVGPITRFDASACPVKIGAEVSNFDGKEWVRPRKSLKLMSRDIQYGFAAADLAMADAGLGPGQVEPTRLGVVYGADMMYCDLEELAGAVRRSMVDGRFDATRWGEAAMAEMFPLWLLRNLPNMVACHVAIVQEAQGPNNTINMSDVSSLIAMSEAVRVIERGAADVMLAGGVGLRINATTYAFRGDLDLSHWQGDPSEASRPFDARRDGLVNGEGAATFVLESREHAAKRGATILARIAGDANSHERIEPGKFPSGAAIRRVIETALRRAGIQPIELSHLNAQGYSLVVEDRYEAQAIHAALGDVPVTAIKSYIGHLGAGGGAVELAASLLGMLHGEVPRTLNYETPDPECPVNVVRDEPLPSDGKAFLKLSHTRLGHAAAVVVAGES